MSNFPFYNDLISKQDNDVPKCQVPDTWGFLRSLRFGTKASVVQDFCAMGAFPVCGTY